MAMLCHARALQVDLPWRMGSCEKSFIIIVVVAAFNSDPGATEVMGLFAAGNRPIRWTGSPRSTFSGSDSSGAEVFPTGSSSVRVRVGWCLLWFWLCALGSQGSDPEGNIHRNRPRKIGLGLQISREQLAADIGDHACPAPRCAEHFAGAGGP